MGAMRWETVPDVQLQTQTLESVSMLPWEGHCKQLPLVSMEEVIW